MLAMDPELRGVLQLGAFIGLVVWWFGRGSWASTSSRDTSWERRAEEVRNAPDVVRARQIVQLHQDAMKAAGYLDEEAERAAARMRSEANRHTQN